MTARVPLSAPDGPPLTGASTATIPFSASPLATSLATRGPVVDRSMNILAFFPATMPFDDSATALTISGVGRLVRTISACDATSAGECAALAPDAVACCKARGSASYTTTL